MNDAANAQLRRLIMGGVVAQAIAAVTELGVVDRLAVTGPATAAELASALDADPDALQRFLRALAAEGLFNQLDGGRFGLTEVGALLRSDTPGSLKYFSRLMTGEAYQVWEQAGLSLRTGRSAFDAVFGKPLFDWLADNPERSAEFNEAQAELARLRLLPLLDLSWNGVSTVVDVGGGHGQLLATLLAKHDQLNGVLFDRPEVVEQAGFDADVAERCQLVGGDFFEEVPAGGDVYVLAQILHDWDDEHATQILRRTRTAMGDGARLLILEQVVPEDGGPHPAKLLDLHMLVLLGGRERTDSHWRRLLANAGFTVAGIAFGPRSALIEAT